MKTMMKAGAFVVLTMLLAGCVRENMEEAGHAIKFSAQAALGIDTRTTYSGDVFTEGQPNRGWWGYYFYASGNTTTIERINWDDNDKIRIYSNEVSSPASKSADYVLTRTTPDGKYDYASSEPYGGDHGLIWGSGQHSFFSVYPAPTTANVASGDPNLSYSNGNGIVEAILPANQTGSTKTTEVPAGSPQVYYGNMNLAYMTAATTGTEGNDIVLSFTPIVTTFYVTLTNTTGTAMTLQKVALSSEANALTGTYQTTFTSANVRTYLYYEEPNNRWVSSLIRTDDNSTIYAEFSNGLTVAANATVTVALFALPQNITQLTLSVVTNKGKVSLPLKERVNNQMEWIQFTGGNKHNISGLAVPDVDYYMNVTPTRLEYDYTGTATSAQQFTVTHSKTVQSTGGTTNTYPVAWKTQIWSADTNNNGQPDDSEFVDLDANNCPAWLVNFPLNSTGKTAANSSINDSPATAHTYQKNVTLQPVTSHVDRLKEGKVYNADGTVFDNSSQANALDLSKYNFISKRKEANYEHSSARTTANTYVVSAPGWYKIPMVYGNLIENGSTVAEACKGARWELGHLDYFKKATEANIYLGINYPWLQSSYLQSARIHWEKYTIWDDNNNQAVTTGRQWSSGSDIGVVKNVTLNQQEEYLYFEVDDTDIRPGNVLLAVYDEDVECTWSWQIWITDQKMDLITVGTNQVLPVNLGWVDDTKGQYYEERSEVLRFVSTEVDSKVLNKTLSANLTVIQPELERVSTSGWQTYYQWGRKDPMSLGVTNTYGDDGTINKSIRHPSNIMYDESNFTLGTNLGNGSEYYDWTSANYNNLWDSQNRDWQTPSSSLPNHKTVYDPSPRGFSVAPDDAWNSFATNGYSSFENGLHFYTSANQDATIFFPASGLLHYATATLLDEGSVGYYWTIHPGENVQRRASYSLRFSKDGQNVIHVVPQSYSASSPFTTPSYRAFAYSVRPVLYNIQATPSQEVQGSSMQEIVFAEHASDWGWSNGQNLAPSTQETVGDVTITITRDANWLGNDPSYSASDGSVSLNRSNSIKVSVPAGHQVIQVNVFFSANDGNLSLEPTPGTNDGAHWSDGNASKDAIWRIGTYTASPESFTPATNEVTISAPYGWSSSRRIYGVAVIYK